MDAHDLYGLPLDRFTPARRALAKELRDAGQRDEAERVGALRKPSRAAWAVNQLVRTQRRAVNDLFTTGDAAQRAQTELLAGKGDSEALRSALSQEREAVRQLVEVARGLLTSDGHELSSTMLERVADTLHAAALDPGARVQVRQGCLDRELHHVGLGPAALTGAGSRTSGSQPAAKARPSLSTLRTEEAKTRHAPPSSERRGRWRPPRPLVTPPPTHCMRPKRPWPARNRAARTPPRRTGPPSGSSTRTRLVRRA